MKLFQSVKIFSVLLLLAVLFQYCSKGESGGSDIPSLEYKGYSKFKDAAGKDSFLTINLTFTDNDGDIGLTESDSFPPFSYGSPYFYNLFADFYVYENGTPTKITSPFSGPDTLYKDTVHFSQRIKNLTPEGKDKSIKGKIDLLTPFFVLDLSASKPDSVHFTISLVDRALHRSNVVQTPIIRLNF